MDDNSIPHIQPTTLLYRPTTAALKRERAKRCCQRYRYLRKPKTDVMNWSYVWVGFHKIQQKHSTIASAGDRFVSQNYGNEDGNDRTNKPINVHAKGNEQTKGQAKGRINTGWPIARMRNMDTSSRDETGRLKKRDEKCWDFYSVILYVILKSGLNCIAIRSGLIEIDSHHLQSEIFLQ